MLRILAVVTLLIPLVTSGCTFQANTASQAVTVNPFAFGSGQVVSPANGYGYVDGVPTDMRR
jgi:high-affinity K+ transport system ATPase subunit B